MQALVAPAPIPEIDPTNANIWHPRNPAEKPFVKELYIKIGVFNIIIKSKKAKFTIKTFDGVRRDLALKIIYIK